MRSDRQEAVDFQNQVCDEVLPSIREHGLYATNEKLERIITSPEFGIRLLSELKDEREACMRESALRERHQCLECTSCATFLSPPLMDSITDRFLSISLS